MTSRARLLEAVAAEVAAHAHPGSPAQETLIQAQLASSVNKVAASKDDTAHASDAA